MDIHVISNCYKWHCDNNMIIMYKTICGCVGLAEFLPKIISDRKLLEQNSGYDRIYSEKSKIR